MSVFHSPDFDGHESVHHFHDAASGLNAIVAIHSTALGPAAGGCRRWQYVSDHLALTDALRLSRGMTYKNAVAGLPFGGGKAVIMADPSAPKTPQLFAAFGRAVNSLGGRYVTAEDVGINMEDMRHVVAETRFVSGLPQSGDDAGGDPSPWTALGVFHGICAAVKNRLGRNDLEDLTVAVQGVGNVGLHLCRQLHKAGAKLVVADVNPTHLQRVADELPVTQVGAEEILFSEADVLAPCALGGILNADSIPKIKAKVIAGGANNQLAVDADGEFLTHREILYAPDYVINAGGIISVAHEYLGKSSAGEVQEDVERIPERLHQVFTESQRTGRPTNFIADELARRIVATGKTQAAPELCET